MIRIEAKQTIEHFINKDFKYLYQKQNIDINTWHFTFRMDSNTHNLQMSLEFQEKWVDILCFISPTILTCNNNNNFLETLQTVNYINWNVKSWGHFYIDDFGDIAYSLRINYDSLNSMPQESIKEIETTVDYYSDLFIPLLNVSQGSKTFDETKLFINDMWGGIK